MEFVLVKRKTAIYQNFLYILEWIKKFNIIKMIIIIINNGLWKGDYVDFTFID